MPKGDTSLPSVMNEPSSPDRSLPKMEILRRRNEIKKCFNNGITWQGKNLRVIYHESNERKVCFIIARRHGNAVIRNRVKRLLREVYRNNKNKVDGYHIILSPKGDSAIDICGAFLGIYYCRSF